MPGSASKAVDEMLTMDRPNRIHLLSSAGISPISMNPNVSLDNSTLGKSTAKKGGRPKLRGGQDEGDACKCCVIM